MLMKKILSLATLAFMATSFLNAQTPEIHPGEAFSGISPDGKYVVSVVYEVVTIHDRAKDLKYEYVESYHVGNGNAISNTGIVVGQSIEDVAQYWKDGEWFDIKSAATRNMSKADGITPDGTRIVGAVSPESFTGGYDGLMLTPCYWDVQADGTIGDFNALPYPEKDLSGRIPQYITAIRVSDDGKTIAGQIMDYGGMVCQPIIYRQNEDGEWSYTLIHNELFHPEGIVLPEDPGEWEDEFPQPEAFMGEEALADYNKAMEEYWETWENMPNAEDYMTEEETAAYQAALAAYNDWDEKWTAFNEAYTQLVQAVPNFTFNNVLLSNDGKTYVSSKQSGDFFSGYTYVPSVFNLENDTYKVYSSDLTLTVTSLANDGTILAQKPATFMNPETEAYILPAGSEKFMPLYDYFVTANPALAEWMKDNMTHEYTVYEYDPETWEESSYTTQTIATGIPFTNADMSLIVIGVENFWFDWENGDIDTYQPAYGYILPTNYVTTSVNALNATDNGKVEYYTIDGRKVNTPVKGLNIVKMANGKTKKTVVK